HPYKPPTQPPAADVRPADEAQEEPRDRPPRIALVGAGRGVEVIARMRRVVHDPRDAGEDQHQTQGHHQDPPFSTHAGIVGGSTPQALSNPYSIPIRPPKRPIPPAPP